MKLFLKVYEITGDYFVCIRQTSHSNGRKENTASDGPLWKLLSVDVLDQFYFVCLGFSY